MHNADNEVTVTEEDRAAALAYWNHPADRRIVPITAIEDDHALAQAFARHRLASIEAACREKDEQLTRERRSFGLAYENWQSACLERDQLRAKLDEARGLLERAMPLSIPYPDWKSDVRAFLTSAPQPLISKDQAIKLAEMEGDAEIGAGMPDHPLRQPEPCNWVQPDGTLEHADKPEQEAQGDGAEPVAWAPTSFRGEGYVYRRKEDAETRTGPATPLYAHPPAPRSQEVGMSEKRYECMIYDCHFPTQTARFRMPSDFLVAGGIYEIRRLRSSTDDDRAVWAGLPDPPEYEEGRPDAD